MLILILSRLAGIVDKVKGWVSTPMHLDRTVASAG
jgi:hypothetical protein